ncbi:MAG: GGDEF domain-containing protein [Actinobacteria bacterium]|nr:GGDEF domain-containing protein [Actinomycetota bacterium]MBV9664197.1 GGDEF domain-containing protein [Actinomycetota bacterium]MBV9932839.1 GGDEF domain-containing protein [Actinomycetota bacterium]
MATPHGSDVATGSAVVLALLGYPFAAGLYLLADRTPMWAMHAVMGLGTVMVTFGIHTASGRMAGSASVLYLWVVIFSAYWFPWRTVAGHLAVIAGSYAIVLVLDHEPAGVALWLGMTGTAVFTAVVVASLSGRLRAQATTDLLTGLPNRRGWEDSLEREFSRALRRRSPLCVAVLDLDNFKVLNDTRGHIAGDRILRSAAVTWQGLLRDTDVLARYGGDEFALILPDCSPEKATEIIDRLSDSTEGSTCSVGVAWAGEADDAQALISRADDALYAAKAAGGGRVVVSGTSEWPGTRRREAG